MNAQNKWRQSTDAHGHSSKLRWLDAEMLSVAPREGLGCAASTTAAAKPALNAALPLCLFSRKQNSSSDFFQLTKTGTQWIFSRSEVAQSKLSKSRDTC